MTDTVGQPVVLSPSPRHMRKRRFFGDVPASQLPEHRALPKLSPVISPAEKAPDTPRKPTADPEALTPKLVNKSGLRPKRASLEQKRLIALALVILVSISIPLLVLTLIFAG